MKFKKFIILLIISFSIQQTHAQWVNRFNGQGDFSDRFNAVLTDASGNVFLAGHTVRTNMEQDILLVKLNPSGDTIWTNIYNGSGNSTDNALAMAMDGSGNIYITGYQKSLNTGTDFVTIKYSNSGTRLWVSTYTYINDQYDQSNSIAVDASGNVYVTGLSDSDPTTTTNDDYVTIKYNSSGIQQWATRMNGSGNGTDRPSKIALDPSGNPVVTGRSDNIANYDYLTIKYNAATGTQIWASIFDQTHNDWATDLIINSSNGNIYVTGRSRSIDYDYVTLCYNSSGTQVWSAIYNNVGDDRATEIALDGSGNIYITGQSDVDATTAINYDITTIKYNTSGTQQWAKTFGGTALNDDIPTALYVDATGNAFVSGTTDTDPTATISNDFITLAYNNSGTSLWSNFYTNSSSSTDAPTSIVADATGNIIVAGYTETIPQQNATTLKYNSAGITQWTKYYNGIGDNSDAGKAIAVDVSNNVYIAGYSDEFNMDRNFSLQKIDPTGNTLWMKTLNGTSTGSRDEASALVIDATGNIYVAGYTHNKGSSSDFTVAKYNPLGDTLWVRNYDYTTESDRAYAIALDGSNNVYVTGKSDGDPSSVINDDVLTIKYDQNGVFQWASRYNGTGNGIDEGRKIKVTSTGNVYVSGKAYNGTNTDYIVIKYNSSGVQQWASIYNGGGNDECSEMAIDNLENLYVSGFSTLMSNGHYDIATLKFSSSGAQQWAQLFSGVSGGNDIGTGIILDQLGNVLVSGITDSDTAVSTINNNVCLIKYDNNGNQQWFKTYNGAANLDDQSFDVGVDISNNIYVTGLSDNGSVGNQNYNYITVKYSPSGHQDTVLSYNGTGNNYDVSNAVLVKGTSIYVTGSSLGTNSQQDMLTIKYDGTVLGVSELSSTTQNLNVYPNPFADFTTIDLSNINTASNEAVNIAIYNIMGETVREFAAPNQNKIILEREGLCSGTYLLKVKQGNKYTSHFKLIIN